MSTRANHRPASLFLLFVLLTMSIGGCGNKGDLYLPEEGVEVAEEADDSEQDR